MMIIVFDQIERTIFRQVEYKLSLTVIKKKMN